MLEIHLGIIVTEGVKILGDNKSERLEKGAQDTTQEIPAWLIFIAHLLCACQAPLGLYLGVKLLPHTVTPCLSFGGSARMHSKAVTPFYIPISNVRVFEFLNILVNTRYSFSF